MPLKQMDVALDPMAPVREKLRKDISRPHFALGRLKTGQLNKSEQAYADYLSQLQAVGGILWHKFEGMKFRLADNTFFSPDFAVMMPDGQIHIKEVKGYMMDDANVKIKVAAAQYPFRFFIVRTRPKRDGGGWIETEVGA